mmetsp:Transcript_102056/g.304551  ORF Transcript_102056/g.304551 Transcript_102056/m.304551 type:complete len:361 (-) Transcript_102056:27-1109(-)
MTPSKRTATTEGNVPPAKKGGFKGMDCPFSKSHFMAHAKDTKMELELQPKVFGPGAMQKYGYQKSGGLAKVEADGPDSSELDDKIAYVRPSCIAHVADAVFSSAEFMKKAKPFKVEFDISPVEFSTGSFGWHAHRKHEVTVDGKRLSLMVNFNAPINKSKEKDEEEEDPVTASIDADAIKKHLPVIGEATAKDKDDLTKIRGIGPWIEKRLNKIKVFTFQQIAKMTSEIEDAVNVAIKYFLGRVRRDEWVLQAQKIVGGKWDELNPLASKASGLVKVDGQDYERKLIAIADHAMADGVIEHFEAEALWFCASDGSKVTSSERKTLEHIMTSDKYKVEDEAKAFLSAKLASLNARGVIPAA